MTVPRSKNRTPFPRKKLAADAAELRKANNIAFGTRAQSDVDWVLDKSRANTPAEARWKADRAARWFKKTDDPIEALISLCVAGEMGVAPPKTVLRWLASCLRQWLDAEGKKSLEHIMGLSGGKNPAVRKRLMKARDEMLHMDVARLCSLPLRALTGERRVSIDEAAEAVANRLAKTDWNNTNWKLDQVAAGTIQNSYKVWPARKSAEEKLKSVTSRWSREQIRRYLLRFDTEKLPPKLKVFLQD